MSDIERFAEVVEQNINKSEEYRTGTIDISFVPDLIMGHALISQKRSDSKIAQRVTDNPDLGLLISQTGESLSIQLQPVNISEALATRGKAQILEHAGWVYVGDADNIEQMRQTGVYGNSEFNRATYLCTTDSRINPNSSSLRRLKQSILIQVDPAKLQLLRDIYVDPETAVSAMSTDVFGESFFVLGGIPAEAITAIAPWRGQALRRIR